MKIKTGSLVSEISGKLGGSVVQKTNGGLMLRSLSRNRAPGSIAQITQRLEFQRLTQIWRTLYQFNRDTWNKANTSHISGFHFFTAVNLLRLSLGMLITVIPPMDSSPNPYENVGLNWVNDYIGVQSGQVNELISVSPTRVLVGSSTPSGLWYSQSDNRTYTRVFTGIASSHIYGIVNCGGGVICASSDRPTGVLRSTDNGLSYSMVSITPADLGLSMFALDELSRIYMVSRTTGKLYYSSNAGVSWSVISTPSPVGFIFSIEYLGNGVFLIGGYNNGVIYRSTDYGVTWNAVFSVPGVGAVRILRYIGNGIVYCGGNPSNILYRSMDYGLTFKAYKVFTGSASLTTMSRCFNGVLMLAIYNTSKLYRSIDYGLSWHYVGLPLFGSYYQSFAFNEYGKFYVGTVANGIVVSSTP
jgi:hypothetical protein